MTTTFARVEHSVVRVRIELPPRVSAAEFLLLTDASGQAIFAMYDFLRGHEHGRIEVARSRYGSPFEIDFAMIGSAAAVVTGVATGITIAINRFSNMRKHHHEASLAKAKTRRENAEASEHEAMAAAAWLNAAKLASEVENDPGDSTVRAMAERAILEAGVKQPKFTRPIPAVGLRALQVLSDWDADVTVEEER